MILAWAGYFIIMISLCPEYAKLVERMGRVVLGSSYEQASIAQLITFSISMLIIY